MSNGVKVFKIVDPIVQSLLFICFAYSFDRGNTFRIILLIILVWQLFSAIVHFFLHIHRKLKGERLIYFFISLIYFGFYNYFYFYYANISKEKYFDINDGDMPLSIPVHEFSIIVPGILISFWYYLICFRELNKILKKNPNG